MSDTYSNPNDDPNDPGRVGRGLVAAREAAGLKLAGAADRTKELGIPIHRVALGKMEAGERVLTIEELFVLAVAYNTSPATILFGDLQVDGNVEVIPGLEVPAVRALQWFSGEKALSDPDANEVGGEVDRYNYATMSVSAARRLDSARELVRFATSEFRDRGDEGILGAAMRTKMQAVELARSLGLIVRDDG